MFQSLLKILTLIILSEWTQMSLSFDQKCPLLRLKNGRVRFSSKGKMARFNCMRTYQLVGVKYVSCIRGQWDAEVPVCVRKFL